MSENRVVKGITISINYVPKESLYPAFGFAWVGLGLAEIREDLPWSIKRFVLAHEIYHLTDKWSWGGWMGRELRANIICGLEDPKGFLATVMASFTRDRIKFYLHRLKDGC